MQYEIRKMFRHQKGLWLVLFYFVLSIAGILLFDTPVNPEIEQNKYAYDYYLQQVEGKCTSETKTFLSKEAKRIAEANNRLQNLYDDYSDGKLTEKEFTSQIAEAEETVRYQKGFELVFEQYNGIQGNKKNRWFLYTNGWDGLLSHDSLDLLFVLLLLLLITPVFCQEYESGMNDLIMTETKGAKRHAVQKIVLVVVVVCVLCLLSSGMQFLFYDFKYGLPHGEYPLQSLSYFATSTRKVTLIGSFLEISLGKLFGSLSLALLILFVSTCVRRYALTLFISTAAILLPYYGISLLSAKYLIPGPLGFMISTGFFRGNEYQYDAATQEKTMVFQEISGTARWLLIGITLCLAIVMAAIVIKKHTNIWCELKLHSKKKAVCFILLLCISVSMFSGCTTSSTVQGHTLFNMVQGNTFENSKYRFYMANPNSDKAVWMMENKSTGKTEKLIRNPMQALSKVSNVIYGYGHFVYYMRIDSDASGFFSTPDHFSVVEVDTRNFSEKIIFERNLDVNRDTFLNIGKPQEQDVKFYSLIEAFFLDDQNLYFIGSGQVSRVNRITGKRDIIIQTPFLKNLSFDGTNIYYINAESKLIRYNVCTGQETKLYGIVTESFVITDKQGVIFMNRLDQNKIYALSLKDGSRRKILNQPVLSFRLDGENIVYVSTTDPNEHRIKLDNKDLQN